MMIKMLKFSITLILFALCITVQSQTTITNFPYNQSFRGTTMPSGWVRPGVIGPLVGQNNAKPLAEGLELTPDRTNVAPAIADNRSKFGGVVLEGVDFNSTNGITISFEFSITGGALYDDAYGDGLTFFLFDAAKPTTLGAAGRGLGYSQGDGFQGVDGGYLGIGFDVFGNFKGANGTRSGTPNTTYQGSYSNNHLTVRGAMGASRYDGYPVLFTRKTDILSNNSNTLSSTLNVGTGAFTNTLAGLANSQTFNFRSGALSTAKGDVNYRKATVTLLPRTGGGFRVSLDVEQGGIKVNILNQFDYPESIKFTNNSTTGTGVETLATIVPAKFQLGFTAGTGFATERHLIRDVEISIPFLAETNPDMTNLCLAFPQQSVVLNPFLNDTFYRGALTGNPTSGNNNQYIDFASVQFSDVDDNPLGGTTSGDKTYTQTGVGIWKTNSTNGNITFTPINGFQGLATIYYTAKGTASQGGPFNQEIYRSAPQKISVNVVRCGSVINAHIPSGGVSRSGK